MTVRSLKAVLGFGFRCLVIAGVVVILVLQLGDSRSETPRRLESLGAVLHRDGFREITGVELSDYQLDPEVFERLSDLPQLRTLTVRNAVIDELILSEIPQLRHLENLCLSDCRLSNSQLKELRTGSLRILSLSGCRGPELRLTSLRITSGLEKLDLSRCDWIRDEDLHSTFSLSQLKTLDLSHTAITDTGASELLTCPGLRTIRLTGCRGLTAQGVKLLLSSPNLRLLELNDLPLSLREVRSMQLNHPEVRLEHSQDLAPDLVDFLAQGFPLPPMKDPPVRTRGVSTTTAFRNGVATAVAARFETSTDFSILNELTGLTSLRLSGPAVDDKAVQSLSVLPQLQLLELSDTRITGDQLHQIPAPQELRTLCLRGAEITAATLRWLQELPQLSRLDLSGVTFRGPEPMPERISIPILMSLRLSQSDISATLLARLKADRLQSLWADGCQLADNTIPVLRQFRDLRTLDLGDNPLTGRTLDALQECPLERLVLRKTHCGPQQIRKIGTWARVPEHLDLSETSCNGDSLDSLSQTNLRGLLLQRVPLADADIKSLAHSRTLEFLDIRDSGLTPSAISHLAQMKALTGIAIPGTDGWVRHLADSPLGDQMTYIEVFRASSEELHSLSRFSRLAAIKLTECEFESRVAEMIVSETRCFNLTLSGCRFSRDSVETLAHAPRFFNLVIGGRDDLIADLADLRTQYPGFQIQREPE